MDVTIGMRLLLTVIFMSAILLAIWLPAQARELTVGQYDNIPPSVRKWFQDQRVPGTQKSCCTVADGTYAEEDIRGGSYWTRFEAFGQVTPWMEVPPETVIHDPNKNGAPVVWFYRDNEAAPIKVRCYSPGGGV